MAGVPLCETLEAQRMLAENHGVAADVWSATSYKQLRDDALAVEPPASNHGIDPDLVDPRDR